MDNNLMTLYDLYKNFQKSKEKEFIVTFDGEIQEAYFSKKKYIFLEEVIFFGEPDVKGTSYTPQYNENNFVLIYEGKKYSLNYRRIRTFLSASFTKYFTKSDSKNAPKIINNILEEKANQVLVCEYGLLPNKKYFAFFEEESYFVNGPKGPQKKSNLVLYISDKHFKNGEPQIEITPLYAGWTY